MFLFYQRQDVHININTNVELWFRKKKLFRNEKRYAQKEQTIYHIFFLLIMVIRSVFVFLGKSEFVENVQISGQVKSKEDFSWLIDLGRLFMLMIKRSCENERLLFLAHKRSSTNKRRSSFHPQCVLIDTPSQHLPRKKERQKHFTPFIRISFANPVNETRFLPFYFGCMHSFFFSLHKTTDKSVKLLLLIWSRKKKRSRKKYCVRPKALNSRKFWRGFFDSLQEMCWSDIRNLFENV